MYKQLNKYEKQRYYKSKSKTITNDNLCQSHCRCKLRAQKRFTRAPASQRWSMAVEVRPLAGALGAEVFGVDIATKISDSEFSEIYNAFLENLVLFFRRQRPLTPALTRVFRRMWLCPLTATSGAVRWRGNDDRWLSGKLG